MAAWRGRISAGRTGRGARGVANLARHVENMGKFGLPVVVALNRFTGDTEAEYAAVRAGLPACRGRAVLPLGGRRGRGGGPGPRRDAARRAGTARYRPLYPDAMALADKLRTVAREIYRAADIALTPAVSQTPGRVRGGRAWRAAGLHRQDAVQLHADPAAGGPVGHVLPVREVGCRPAPGSWWRCAATS